MSPGTYPEVSIVAAGDLHTNGRQPLAKDQDPLAEKELEVFTDVSGVTVRAFGKRVALFKELLDGGFTGGLLSGGHNPTGDVVEFDFLAGKKRRELAPKNSCPWNIERPFRQTPSKQPRHSHQVPA